MSNLLRDMVCSSKLFKLQQVSAVVTAGGNTSVHAAVTRCAYRRTPPMLHAMLSGSADLLECRTLTLAVSNLVWLSARCAWIPLCGFAVWYTLTCLR